MLAHRPAGTSSARRGRARCRAAGRLAMALAAVTCTLLYSAAIMPAAWAVNVIANDGPAHASAGGLVTAGGMPGWQITLIALGAAGVSATAAVLWSGRGPPAGQPRPPPRDAPIGGENSGRARTWSGAQAQHPPVRAAPVRRTHAAPDDHLGLRSRRIDTAGAPAHFNLLCKAMADRLNVQEPSRRIRSGGSLVSSHTP